MGKLFKKLKEVHPEFNNLSANSCSKLTYKELINVARTLYPDHKITLGHDYMRMPYNVLAGKVYRAMSEM